MKTWLDSVALWNSLSLQAKLAIGRTISQWLRMKCLTNTTGRKWRIQHCSFAVNCRVLFISALVQWTSHYKFLIRDFFSVANKQQIMFTSSLCLRAQSVGVRSWSIVKWIHFTNQKGIQEVIVVTHHLPWIHWIYWHTNQCWRNNFTVSQKDKFKEDFEKAWVYVQQMKYLLKQKRDSI